MGFTRAPCLLPSDIRGTTGRPRGKERVVIEPVWTDPRIVQWTQWLLDSYRQWISRDLIERTGGPEQQARTLFDSLRVVVSHGMEADPLINYANRAAQELWEMPWERLVTMPSRLTAEPGTRAERERMLDEVRRQGYTDRYRGVRVTATGRRFLVESATVWNVLDGTGVRVGQAASFIRWQRMP